MHEVLSQRGGGRWEGGDLFHSLESDSETAKLVIMKCRTH